MMTGYMVVSLDQGINGRWYATLDGCPLEWVRSLPAWAWLSEPATTLERHRATLQRFRVPGWMVVLAFYVDDRLRGAIPRGHVLPGWIEGTSLDAMPIDFNGSVQPWW